MRTAVLTILFLARLVTAQQTSTVHPNVSGVLERMKDPTWSERQKAFEDATNLAASSNQTPSDADRLRVGIIQLLTKENNGGLKEQGDETKHGPANPNGAGATQEEDGEDQSEYYAGLIGFVAGLNDERAITALLGAAGTGSVATRGVARFGKKALDPVLAQIQSKDSDLASGAVFVLRSMLEFHTVSDPDSLLRIKNALISAIGSPEWDVRLSAIGAIEYWNDREEFVPLLKNLAEHDPHKIPGQPKWDGTIGDGYPVRELATKLLREITNHESPTIDQGVSD